MWLQAGRLADMTALQYRLDEATQALEEAEGKLQQNQEELDQANEDLAAIRGELLSEQEESAGLREEMEWGQVKLVGTAVQLASLWLGADGLGYEVCLTLPPVAAAAAADGLCEPAGDSCG